MRGARRQYLNVARVDVNKASASASKPLLGVIGDYPEVYEIDASEE